jgi:phosphoglycolate phosphatase
MRHTAGDFAAASLIDTLTTAAPAAAAMPSPMTATTRRFDLIVFDWDGTLFDSTALIVRCMQGACADLGLPVPSDERAAYVIGLGLHDALQYIVPGLGAERYPELGRRYRHHYVERQHELVLFPGTLEMLHALKGRNHWLAVATGKSRAGLDESLHAVQLRGLFDGTRTADETAGKPNPLMLQQLMSEFGVDPARTLMIGDTSHDLQLAINAGTASVAVSYGAHEADAFSRLAPLHVAHSTTDLHDWLLAHG